MLFTTNPHGLESANTKSHKIELSHYRQLICLYAAQVVASGVGVAYEYHGLTTSAYLYATITFGIYALAHTKLYLSLSFVVCLSVLSHTTF